MSSPASRRSNRNSATPRRTSRASQAPATSPDNQLQSEASQASQSPRSSRGQPSAKNVPSSSPLRFGSSAKSARSGISNGADASSPLRQRTNASDGDRTPRANRTAA